jgi:hypothetical protein
MPGRTGKVHYIAARVSITMILPNATLFATLAAAAACLCFKSFLAAHKRYLHLILLQTRATMTVREIIASIKFLWREHLSEYMHEMKF